MAEPGDMDGGGLWREIGGEAHAIDQARLHFPHLAEAALVDRRMAMRLMGASAALALASGCEGGNPARKASPGSRDWDTTDRRTTLAMNGLGFGVIVKTANGMPVKIEGDPDHPASLGRSNIFAQAAILSYYDPARPDRALLRGGAGAAEKLHAAIDALARSARQGGGAGLHILIEPVASPTLERMVEEARAALPQARFYAHRPIALAANAVAGLDTAHAIVSLGADFLGPGPMQVRHAADFMAGRRAALDAGEAHTMLVAESVPSLTGARADRRIVAGPARIERIARALAEDPVADPEAGRIAAALDAAADRGVLAVGEQVPQGLRTALAARYGGPIPERWQSTLEGLPGIADVTAALEAGEVEQLLILSGNPAYNAPAPVPFLQAMAGAKASLYLGEEDNETARLCGTHLAARPHLASWGDLRAFDGSVSPVRPVAPGAGISAIEFLARLAGVTGSGRELVAQTHGASPQDLGEESWSPAPAPLPAAPATAIEAPPPSLAAPQGLALAFLPDATVWDGALAANGWAQELPDPMTALAWGNAVTIAPALADRYDLKDGDEIELRHGARRLTAPARILPGQAEEVLGISLGYGRQFAGVGSGIGANAYALRGDGPLLYGVTLRATGRHVALVRASPYQTLDDIDAVRWTRPGAPAIRDEPFGPSFVDPQRRADRQWGMAIDLDACIGCNACTIACQAENNIPVVGPEETRMGRAMHWLRVDKYHRGRRDNPETSFQPVPCMHCETAPCEPVCPVGATTHSSEGLNQMTYNRCIGTRSCSNNCPYKVRKYNWYDYREEPANRPDEGTNPRVTVRDRGVMEKCTYCVQRIEAARVEEGGGVPMTACQQACPTQAITFGDISDPASEVSQARRSPRNYELLDGLNLRPRTTYLARLKADGGGDG